MRKPASEIKPGDVLNRYGFAFRVTESKPVIHPKGGEATAITYQHATAGPVTIHFQHHAIVDLCAS